MPPAVASTLRRRRPRARAGTLQVRCVRRRCLVGRGSGRLPWLSEGRRGVTKEGDCPTTPGCAGLGDVADGARSPTPELVGAIRERRRPPRGGPRADRRLLAAIVGGRRRPVAARLGARA